MQLAVADCAAVASLWTSYIC